LDLYLKLMCVEPWEVLALDAVATLLQHDPDRTEPRLLEKDAGRQLLTLLAEASRHTCAHMLEPFLRVGASNPPLCLRSLGGWARLRLVGTVRAARCAQPLIRCQVVSFACAASSPSGCRSSPWCLAVVLTPAPPQPPSSVFGELLREPSVRTPNE